DPFGISLITGASSPVKDVSTIIMAVSNLIMDVFVFAFVKHVRVTIETKKNLVTAPGTRAYKVVDFLFRPTTVELTFKPLIADWQFEYFEALNQGRKYKAHWIMIRYRFLFARTFILAMGLSKVFSFFKQLSK